MFVPTTEINVRIVQDDGRPYFRVVVLPGGKCVVEEVKRKTNKQTTVARAKRTLF